MTQKLNKIDNEVKNLANRIKKSPNYNLYKNSLKKHGTSLQQSGVVGQIK